MTGAALVLVAFVTVIPTITTGIFVAKGRYNEKGKPYIERGVQVAWTPENTRIARHQVIGVLGFAVALGLSCSPCSVHGSSRCPLGHHRCLADLDAERVAAACREVLA